MLYTNKTINTITAIITIVIFIILNLISNNFQPHQNHLENILGTISNKDDKDNENISNEQSKNKETDLGNWYIQIPAINLSAPIAEGTSAETLNTKVGHFEETSLTYGNVGLAAHNRGYECNFFENLKKLKEDDEIIYKYENYQKTYIVDKTEIIENTDWSYLEPSDENTLTLITCVENEPQYRRCIQAIEQQN